MKISLFIVLNFATLLFALTESNPALANVSCGPTFMTRFGYASQCAAGIPSTALDVTGLPGADEQTQTEWCWAATISGIFAYYGHPISQQEIVGQAYGVIANIPGTPQAIMSSLNRTWTDDNGATFTSVANAYGNKFTAAQDLAANYPLIVASLGHAMIMTAVTYYRYTNGNGYIQSVEVRDPWPLNPQRRALSPQEIANASMLIRIRVH